MSGALKIARNPIVLPDLADVFRRKDSPENYEKAEVSKRRKTLRFVRIMVKIFRERKILESIRGENCDVKVSGLRSYL